MIQQVSHKGLQQTRAYFQSGVTMSYAFRKKQLENLQKAIVDHESEIFDALYADLRKSAEESYATETGLVQAEIRFALKRLKEWMRPQKLETNLLNFPSTTRLYREPLGVNLIIGSWNYPFQLVIMPLIGAIAGGNCAVLKPSEVAPATSRVIADLIAATFPQEYISVYEGEGRVVVPALMQAIRFDHIFYTGSAGVARSIYEAAAKELIPVTLELGGKSPAVVEKDADLRTAARRIVLGKFVNAGQTCVAPDYVLVHASVKDKLLAKLADTTKTFFGPDAAKSHDYGRMIHQKHFDRLMAMLPEADRIVYGGRHNREDLYLEPTIVDNVTADDPLMQEEIFGPLLPVIPFDERQEALETIAAQEKPLSFYLFTSSKKVEDWWMRQVSFGSGCVNNTIWHLSNPHLPFGGVGASGIGNYHGKYSFETFTHAKAVMKTPTWFDPSVKYPPFKGRLWLFRKLIR